MNGVTITALCVWPFTEEITQLVLPRDGMQATPALVRIAEVMDELDWPREVKF